MHLDAVDNTNDSFTEFETMANCFIQNSDTVVLLPRQQLLYYLSNSPVLNKLHQFILDVLMYKDSDLLLKAYLTDESCDFGLNNILFIPVTLSLTNSNCCQYQYILICYSIIIIYYTSLTVSVGFLVEVLRS